MLIDILYNLWWFLLSLPQVPYKSKPVLSRILLKHDHRNILLSNHKTITNARIILTTWHFYILKNFFAIRCSAEGKRNVAERHWRRLVEYRRDLLLVKRLTLSCMWLLNRSRKRRSRKSFGKKRTIFLLLLGANEYLRPKTILGICGLLRGILL